MTSTPGELPVRSGPRPRTTPTNPHTQLDQQPDDPSTRSRLRETLDALPAVVWQESGVSVPGAQALCLADDAGNDGPAAAFMVGREFAHLHPVPDQSLHAMVPPELVAELVDKGWAEPHPLVARGLLPPTAVMVYAPRDDAEAAVVAGIVASSHAFALGQRGRREASPERRGQADRVGADLIEVDCLAALESLRAGHAFRTADHAAATLAKHPGISVLLVALRAGGVMREHRAAGAITVQGLQGRIRLDVGEQVVEIVPGRLVSVAAGLPHRVVGIDESAFLLTMGGG